MTPGFLRSLSDEDSGVIRGCLNAAVHGPFFPDWEFNILIGLTRSEVAVVLTRWPTGPEETPPWCDSPQHFQVVAVNNVMNNLFGYPHGIQEEAFVREVGASEQQVAETLTRWRSDDAFNPDEDGYIDRLM